MSSFENKAASKSVLFLAKKGDEYARAAQRLLSENFRVSAAFGEWEDCFPSRFENWSGDFIISYLSRWIVPKALLSRARIAAINFHPGSPEFPGIGCCNFALYLGAPEYGVTCHHMWPKVDTGPIIAVRRFPTLSTDDVGSLLERTYRCQWELFREIASVILCGAELPISKEKWGRAPYTRREYNELNRVTPAMSEGERTRRIRACAFGAYFPRIEAAC